MANTSKIQLDQLKTMVDEWNASSQSFVANVPKTSNSCASAFSALAAAGFETSSINSYDEGVESLNIIFTNYSNKLSSYVDSSEAADSRVEKELEEEVVEAQEEGQNKDGKAEVAAGDDVGGLKDEADQDKGKDSKQEELDDTHKQKEEEKLENINDKPRTEAPATGGDGTQSGGQQNLQQVNTNPPQDPGTSVNGSQQGFNEITRTELQSILHRIIQTAMENNISVKELFTNPRYKHLLRGMLPKYGIFSELYNSDDYQIALYEKLFGKNGLYGLNSNTTSSIKNHLSKVASQNNKSLEEFVQDSNGLRSALSEYQNNVSDSVYTSSILTFSDEELKFAVNQFIM